MKEEVWGTGNVYTNNWAAPTYMVNVEDKKLRGGGYHLKQQIWDAAKPTIEEWTGMELKQTSMYGIRVYTEGAILSPHVDRLPLVSSCIINVDQDVDEPWHLEVYDRNDRAVNVTMEPGDMVLYESGSLMHGRPFPLKGRYYANVFIHFEPTGKKIDGSPAKESWDDFFPPYILPDSPETENWERRNPQGWRKAVPSATTQQINSPEGHRAAAMGDVDSIKKLVKTDKRLLRKRDGNGWSPLHEAIRGGHKDIVVLLIEQGSDINERTRRDRKGSSPLHLALEHHSMNHPVTQYLVSLGAVDISDDEL